MKELWFIHSSEELNVGSHGTGSICSGLKWWLVILALPCYGNSKVCLAHCASWCHVSLLGAVRGMIPPFLLPPQAENIKGRGDVCDGRAAFFFQKGKHHRVSDGRDPNRDVCDVTRQTGTYFPLVSRCQAGGSLSGADGTITLLSQGGIHRGGEKLRDSGEDRALWSPLPSQLGSFSYNRNRVLWDQHTICTILSFLFFSISLKTNKKINLNLWP